MEELELILPMEDYLDQVAAYREDDRLVGMVDVRHTLNAYLERCWINLGGEEL